MPDIQVNYIAILIAVFVNFIFGFIWYTVLFGRASAEEVNLNLDFDHKTPVSEMARSMRLNVLANFFLTYVLAYSLAILSPATWGSSVVGQTPIALSFYAVFFIWLGFMVPVLMNSVAWENTPWKLFAINSAYYFCTLLIAALIITHF